MPCDGFCVGCSMGRAWDMILRPKGGVSFAVRKREHSELDPEDMDRSDGWSCLYIPAASFLPQHRIHLAKASLIFSLLWTCLTVKYLGLRKCFPWSKVFRVFV